MEGTYIKLPHHLPFLDGINVQVHIYGLEFAGSNHVIGHGFGDMAMFLLRINIGWRIHCCRGAGNDVDLMRGEVHFTKLELSRVVVAGQILRW